MDRALAAGLSRPLYRQNMKPTKNWAFSAAAFHCLNLSWLVTVAGEQVEFSNVRRVFDNGERNAFTDLIRFKGVYYLTFRSCLDGHSVHPTSSIIILSSWDAVACRKVHRFSVALRDVRDPHFLEFKDRLFVYSGSWYCGESSSDTRDMNELLGYGFWTADGVDWSDPIMLEGNYGRYVSRAAAHNGKAWLGARRIRQFAQATRRAERDPLVE